MITSMAALEDPEELTPFSSLTSAASLRLDNYYQTLVDPDFHCRRSVGIHYRSHSERLSDDDPDYFEDALSYRNFDYSQESFASNVTVLATQFEVEYDNAGNILSRTATGVVDRFTTGADGYYYFDVETNPEPPAPGTPAYDAWFVDFGKLFEYEISLEGVDTSRILTNEDGGNIGYFDLPEIGNVIFDDANLKYDVQINAAPGVTGGETTKIANINFLLQQDPAETQGTVNGQLFVDLDGDGTFNNADTPAPNVLVYIDQNNNGALDSGEPNINTDASGNYTLVQPNAADGQQVTVKVDQTDLDSDFPDHEFLNPADGDQTVTLVKGGTVTANFTLKPVGFNPGVSAVLSGTVYQDRNGNAIQDADEGILPNVRVYVDANANNQFDAGELNAISTPAGVFSITTPGAGTYDILADLTSLGGADFEITDPAGGVPLSVTVADGGVVNTLAIGLRSLLIQDFGDLILDTGLGLNYPTLLADNGARHIVINSGANATFLGARVDVESDGIETTDATGDDAINEDDEDGVVLLTAVTPSSTIDLDITATGAGAVLNAWIDFNNDGDWDDTGEQIMVDQAFISGTTNRFTVPTPADVDLTADFFASRFRVGPFGLNYDGPANAGEVEDYLLARREPLLISGEVRRDVDGGLSFDIGDDPVAGVVVFYDENVDGVRQASEVSSTTNALGMYSLPINATGVVNVTIRVDQSTLPDGLTFLVPPDGIFNQTLNPSQQVTANFLVGALQGAGGLVYSDTNNNGTQDGSESGVAGITVELYDDSVTDGVFDVFIGSDVTDANGDYFIGTGSAGDFEVRLNLSNQEFVTQTEPVSGGNLVDVLAGQVAAVANFGIFDAKPSFTEDFGDLFVDASNNFPTTLGQNGPRHTVVNGVFLGSQVDADPGSLTSTLGDADDISLTDDEDGVTLLSNQIQANSTIQIDVAATDTIGGAVLNAWIDFNSDGDWLDPGEQIATDLALTSGVTTTLVIDTPADIASGTPELAARFRWGAPGLGFTGAANSGEVEDYVFNVVSLATGPVPGDVNGDGLVGLADLNLIGFNWSLSPATLAQGDLSGDGLVGLADMNILGFNFPLPQEALATGSAPEHEPGTDDADSIIIEDPVSLADLNLLGAGYQPESSLALATAPIDPPGTPKLVLHGPAVVEVDQAASVVLPTTTFARSIIDESVAVEEPATISSDASEAALLEWADSGRMVSDYSDEGTRVSREEADTSEEDQDAIALAIDESLWTS